MVRIGERFYTSLGLCAAAEDVLGAVALHEAGRPRRRVPRERLGHRLRRGPPHQDVHRSDQEDLPDHLGYIEAAAFPLTFLTAWHMLELARLRDGESVLVLAGGSGVGQAAIQIARHRGARVFATSASEKIERTRALGAEVVFDHYTSDFAREARALTNGHGVDVVIEHVGEATWDRSVKALANGGRIVTCGATTGYRASLDLRHLFARQLSMLGSYMGAKAELASAARLFFAGQLSPVIDDVVPLSAAAAAQSRLEARQHFGKIVLTPE